MTVCLKYESIGIQLGIAMPGSEYPLVVQVELQIEIEIFLVGLTEGAVNG